MRTALGRGKNRVRPVIEALEGRALLAVAGSLDPAFGGGYGTSTMSTGLPVASVFYTTTYSVKSSFDAQADSVAALPGGGVVVAGVLSYTTTGGGTTQSSDAIAIEELKADGSPNTAFGTNGLVKLPISSSESIRLAVETSGQVLVAYASSGTYIVAELNTNGSLDSGFGTGGVAYYPAGVTTPVADRIDEVAGVFVQSGGQVVVAGSSSVGFSAVRLNSDGTLDTTYGTDGTATVPATSGDSDPAIASAAVMQANGQVVIAGNLDTYQDSPIGIGVVMFVNSDVGVTRLNADGSLDTTFGGSTAAGLVVIPPDMAQPTYPGFNFATGVAVDPNTGKILLTGFDALEDGPNLNTLYRLNTGGTFDTSFGTGGLVNPTLPGLSTIQAGSSSLVIEPNSDIVLANEVAFTAPQRSYADKIELIGLNPDGSTDTSFGGGTTPGLVLTGLTSNDPPTPVISPTTGDLLVAGEGTVGALSGLTYGFTVASYLSTATSGATAKPAPLPPPADFSGLGHSDAAVYQPSSVSPVDPNIGSFVSQSVLSPGIPGIYDAYGSGGVGGSIPAAADYLGVGFDQVAVYLPSIGVYTIQSTAGSTMESLQLGIAGVGQTIPVPADYYGTGQADIAVYMPKVGAFAIKDPSGKTPGVTVFLGIPGAGQSIPAPADYFGTGLDDIAVYLTQSATFAIINPATQQVVLAPYGKPGVGQSIPVPGDYDGSGQTELAVYIPSFGAYIYHSAITGKDVIIPIGKPNSGDIPVPGDYDGSGRTEAAVYNQDGGFIEYQPANGGPEVTISIGTAGVGSLPVAGPTGSFPGFGAHLSATGSVDGIRPGAVVAPTSPTAASSSLAATPKASVVPSVPSAASIRVALALINQAAPDPDEAW